jgi:hypothetical protein
MVEARCYTIEVAPRKGALARDRNPNWKQGRSVASNGYVLIKAADHPLADVRGYVYEHRLVACQMLGRPLRRSDVVHHLNGDKADNRPENLEIMTRWQHRKEHRTGRHGATYSLRDPGEGNPMARCECGCGTMFARFDAQGRSRRFVSGHNLH